MMIYPIINVLLGMMIYKVSVKVSEKKNSKIIGYLIFNAFIILSLILWYFLLMEVIYYSGERIVSYGTQVGTYAEQVNTVLCYDSFGDDIKAFKMVASSSFIMSVVGNVRFALKNKGRKK